MRLFCRTAHNNVPGHICKQARSKSNAHTFTFATWPALTASRVYDAIKAKLVNMNRSKCAGAQISERVRFII